MAEEEAAALRIRRLDHAAEEESFPKAAAVVVAMDDRKQPSTKQSQHPEPRPPPPEDDPEMKMGSVPPPPLPPNGAVRHNGNETQPHALDDSRPILGDNDSSSKTATRPQALKECIQREFHEAALKSTLSGNGTTQTLSSTPPPPATVPAPDEIKDANTSSRKRKSIEDAALVCQLANTREMPANDKPKDDSYRTEFRCLVCGELIQTKKPVDYRPDRVVHSAKQGATEINRQGRKHYESKPNHDAIWNVMPTKSLKWDPFWERMKAIHANRLPGLVDDLIHQAMKYSVRKTRSTVFDDDNNNGPSQISRNLEIRMALAQSFLDNVGIAVQQVGKFRMTASQKARGLELARQRMGEIAKHIRKISTVDDYFTKLLKDRGPEKVYNTFQLFFLVFRRYETCEIFGPIKEQLSAVEDDALGP